MKPFHPRLLRAASAARRVLGYGAVLGLLRTFAIIGWCWFLSQAIAAIAIPFLTPERGGPGRVAEGAPAVSEVPWFLAAALAAVLLRSAAGWGIDALAARGAVHVKTQLRSAALDAIDAQSPAAFERQSDATLTTTLGRGLDALDGYFATYVPQLVLTAVATPILVVVVLLADPLSGVIVLIVFPIIPMFMALIGMATQAVQDRQWERLQRLSRAFLDVVSGLTTLKLFRREDRQIARIAQETEAYRRGTMRVLRVTFLSGFVLDLAGTFSIALVAVTVGTRLVDGQFPLALGLFILLLMPEVFIPIRQVGAAFHASTEGLAAAEGIFAIIDEAKGGSSTLVVSGAPQSSSLESKSTTQPVLSMQGVSLKRGGRSVVTNVNLECRPGEVVAITGPSGAGKSTLFAAILGQIDAEAGSITRPHLMAWAGQLPGLVQGTVAQNLALGGTPDAALARDVLDEVGLDNIRLDLKLGALGAGLSGGQSQRVAIARALFRARQLGADLLLLDEPSSALDSQSEQVVAAVIRGEAHRGRSVLFISHRPQLIATADRVIALDPVSHMTAHSNPHAREDRLAT